MLKKLTLVTITTLSLLVITAQAESHKCGTAMLDKPAMQKGQKKRHGVSPLLMRLPNIMKIIMKHDSDLKLALTEEQKTKLKAGREARMPKLIKLKGEVKVLQKEIKDALHTDGVTIDGLKAKVDKLAQLKTEATMIKVGCIVEVKSILSKAQCDTVKAIKKAKYENRKKKASK